MRKIRINVEEYVDLLESYEWAREGRQPGNVGQDQRNIRYGLFI